MKHSLFLRLHKNFGAFALLFVCFTLCLPGASGQTFSGTGTRSVIGSQTTALGVTYYGNAAPNVTPSAANWRTVVRFHVDTSAQVQWAFLGSTWKAQGVIRRVTPPPATATNGSATLDYRYAQWQADGDSTRYTYDFQEGCWSPLGVYRHDTIPTNVASGVGTGAVCYEFSPWLNTDNDSLYLYQDGTWLSVGTGSGGGGSGIDNFYRDGDTLRLAAGVDTFSVSAVEPDSAVYATLTTLADSMAIVRDSIDALRADIGTGGGGSGTVTSVGLSLPSIFSVSGSPVTTTGTLTATFDTQANNSVFAGPSSGGPSTPSFRVPGATDVAAWGGVTGTGTANQLGYFSGTSALTSSSNFAVSGVNLSLAGADPKILHGGNILGFKTISDVVHVIEVRGSTSWGSRFDMYGVGDATLANQFSTFGNSYLNGTNPRLGIGTNSPTVAIDAGTKTDGFRLPQGTDGQRAGSVGTLRYSTTSGYPEYNDGTDWRSIASQTWVQNNAVNTVGGTLNQIAYFSASKAIASSSNFAISGVNLSLAGSDPRILHGGNVLGVKTISDAVNVLEVRGSTSFGSRIDIYQSGDATKAIQLSTISGQHTYFNATGVNVGIFTTSPAYPFDVNSTGGVRLALGTTAQRPTGAAGVFRGNSTTLRPDYHNGTAWRQLLDLPDATPPAQHSPVFSGGAWTTGATGIYGGSGSIANNTAGTLISNGFFRFVGANGTEVISMRDGTTAGQGSVALYSTRLAYVYGGDSTALWGARVQVKNPTYSLAGLLEFHEARNNGTNSAKLQSPASLSADYTLTLPPDDGETNGKLMTDGSGVLSWQTPSRAEISATATRHYTLTTAATNYTIDTLSSAFLTDFTYSAGVLTYTGTPTKRFLISYALSIATDDSVLLSAGVDKNGAGPLTSTRQAASIGTNAGHVATANISGTGIVGLATNDTLKIVIQSDGAGAPIASVRYASLTITPID